METKENILINEFEAQKQYKSTRNACKQCSPLGASVAFKGVRGCLPLIHGSQGCATYIRRYMISHYKEPVDIASSNFSEESTIFGGNKNFCIGIDNIIKQYDPEVICIASTCLSETIGEDVLALISEYKSKNKGKKLPEFVYASTPSYQGSHMDGFHSAVSAIVSQIAEPPEGRKTDTINVMPGFVSPEDLRHVDDILNDFGLNHITVADYSEALDNPAWDEYLKIPDGGTPVSEIKKMGQSRASIEFGYVMNKGGLSGKTKANKAIYTAGQFLEEKHGVKNYSCGIPIGIKETDRFFDILEELSGVETPIRYQKERGRLIDAYVDAHKYLFGKRAIVYGEEDLVIGIVSFLIEIGIEPILVASGGESGVLKKELEKMEGFDSQKCVVGSGMDFEKIKEWANVLKPDVLIGSSKGYYIARELQKPLVRVGFPIHDRFGGQRVQHIGYRGTQQLFDRITNALVSYKQEHSPVGWKYM